MANSRLQQTRSRRRRYQPALELLEQRNLLAFTITDSAAYISTPRFVVDFSAKVLVNSIAQSDLQVTGGATVTGMTKIDDDTYSFALSGFTAGGNYTFSFAQNSVTADPSGELLTGYTEPVSFTNPQYVINQNPRLQPGNAPLSGFGYTDSDKDRVDVLWQTIPATGTTGTSDSFTVEYRLTGSNGPWQSAPASTFQDAPTGNNSRRVFTATIKGLEWKTEYDYRVRRLQGGAVANEFTSDFFTRYAKGDETPFTFVAYGDSAGNGTSYPFVQASINSLRDSLETQGDPLFAVLLGDNVYDSGTFAESDYLFGNQTTVNSGTVTIGGSTVPKYTISDAWASQNISYLGIGNHDVAQSTTTITDTTGRMTQMSYSVPVPNATPGASQTAPFSPTAAELAGYPERNFSWDYGDVHFVAFDSNIADLSESSTNLARIDALLDWIVKDMNASTAQWKIIYGHHPWTGTEKAESPADQYYQRFVQRLTQEAKIDVFLSGHSHTYMWTYPLTGQSGGTATYVNRGVEDYFFAADGLPQVVSGMGGRDKSRTVDFSGKGYVSRGWSATTNSFQPIAAEYGYSKVDVTQDTLTISYINAITGLPMTDGTFTITKEAPPPSISIRESATYTGTQDTFIGAHSSFSGTAQGAALEVDVDTDEPTGNGTTTQGLLRFNNIFGTGAGQIPPNSEILSAVLQLNTTNTTANGFSLYRMTADWDENSTWNSLSGGISLGSETEATPDASILSVGSTGPLSIDVLDAVRAWRAAPSSNKGWVFVPGGTDGYAFASSEVATESNRPTLIVTYHLLPTDPTAPVAVDDTANATVGTPVNISVLGNDTDANGDILSIVSVGSPSHGSATIVDNKIRYQPLPGYVGTDTFTYMINDGTGLTDVGLVTVEVAHPTAVLVFMQGCEGCPISCGCGYRGTIDTYLRQDYPNASGRLDVSLMADSSPTAQSLLRFEGLFGSGAWQIPAGATIASAHLELALSSTGSGLSLYRMANTWSDSGTWNSFTNGIQTSGAGAETVTTLPDATITNFTSATATIDVTSSLLAWQSDPAKNHGWAILSTGANATQFSSSEGGMPPRLVVKLRADLPTPPSANDDFIFTDKNAAATISILNNDLDLNGGIL